MSGPVELLLTAAYAVSRTLLLLKKYHFMGIYKNFTITNNKQDTLPFASADDAEVVQSLTPALVGLNQTPNGYVRAVQRALTDDSSHLHHDAEAFQPN